MLTIVRDDGWLYSSRRDDLTSQGSKTVVVAAAAKVVLMQSFSHDALLITITEEHRFKRMKLRCGGS